MDRVHGEALVLYLDPVTGTGVEVLVHLILSLREQSPETVGSVLRVPAQTPLGSRPQSSPTPQRPMTRGRRQSEQQLASPQRLRATRANHAVRYH